MGVPDGVYVVGHVTAAAVADKGWPQIGDEFAALVRSEDPHAVADYVIVAVPVGAGPRVGGVVARVLGFATPARRRWRPGRTTSRRRG